MKTPIEPSTEPINSRGLMAALITLAQSNFDLVAAQTGKLPKDAQRAFQDIYNSIGGF
jgi:hypothetical protein